MFFCIKWNPVYDSYNWLILAQDNSFNKLNCFIYISYVLESSNLNALWGSEALNYRYRNQLSYITKLGRGNSKVFLYNLELLLTFLQLCHSTSKISNIFFLSIELLVPSF